MEKKQYFKNGNPELTNYFSDKEYADMTERDKAMWTPYTDADHAPIPAEVLDFQKEAENTLVNELKDKVKGLEDLLKSAEEENLALKQELEKVKEPIPKNATAKDETVQDPDPDAEKKLLKEVLRNAGVRYAHNASLERLREQVKQLEDANNSK